MYTFNASSWCYECTRSKCSKIWFGRGLKTASLVFRDLYVDQRLHLWYVWKGGCLKVVQDLEYPQEELIMNIWFTITDAYEGSWTKFATSLMKWSLHAYTFGKNGGTRRW